MKFEAFLTCQFEVLILLIFENRSLRVEPINKAK